MKKIFILLSALVATVAASAQTWKLLDMSDEQFAQGGDQQWSFQKFSYETGEYSNFTLFDDGSTVNYVDIYQPERVGGMLIQNLENVYANGEMTKTYWRRNAWYDTAWEEPTRENANAKFIYVSRLPELDNAFEVIGNQQYTSVISFSVPADGWYKATGSIIRQDGANLKAINVVPRFRYKGVAQIDPEVTMGLAFAFGEGGSQLPDAANTSLADGANQRYTAQQPTSFAFAFRGKAGDIVSFEVNYKSLPPSGWPRDYYPRSFYRELTITEVSEETARAEEYLSDPYDETVLENVTATIDQYRDRLSELETGSDVGCVPEADWLAFDNLLTQFEALLEDGTINASNAQNYINDIEQAWKRVLASIIRFDPAAQGNYVLFHSSGNIGEESFKVESDEEAMAENTDQPWGFYSHVVANGTLEKLENHDESNMLKEIAWYRGANQWFYIGHKGQMHPLTDRAPAIMFTAMEDGIYYLGLTLYRPNPNPNVENPLYVRWYHMQAGTESVATSNAILSAEYGSVANDGEGGKKPVSTAFYANLKQGDRVFFEVDAYTSNRNSSAGTQILDLVAYSHTTDDEPITGALAQESGLLFINPYAAGDCTQLKAAVAEAEELLATTVAGTAPGQYPEEARQALQATLESARACIQLEGDASLTQGVVDDMTRTVLEAIEAYKSTRVPTVMQPEGEYSIRLAGTDKFLTKKNAADDTHYYAAITDYVGVEADAAKNNVEMDQYSWTFTFQPVPESTGVTITTPDGYLSNDGYVIILPTDTETEVALPVFTLVKENAEDEVFAIRRESDGRYWNSTMSWKAPYDIIATSETPLYIWTLSTATLTGVENITTAQTAGRKSNAVYDLTGRRIHMSGKYPQGVYIKDGRKLFIR